MYHVRPLFEQIKTKDELRTLLRKCGGDLFDSVLYHPTLFDQVWMAADAEHKNAVSVAAFRKAMEDMGV
jgi:hypothetical protein